MASVIVVMIIFVLLALAILFICQNGGWQGGCGGNCAGCHSKCAEAATFRRKSKVCRNQISTVATKIMVKAFCKKSRAFSQISWQTLRAEGKR